jgi:uncharacterized membrane protein
MMRMKSAVAVLVMLATLAIGGVCAYSFNLPGLGGAEKVKAANGVVSIPVAKVVDGKAHYFRYTDAGKEIAFFVVKAADGSIKVAFDACDACYREKKGYEQQGNVMLCRNCRMKFAIDRLGPNATGGCNPSFLPHKEANGKVVVAEGDLKAGERFF